MIRWLFGYIKKHRLLLAGAIVFAACSGVLAILAPALLGQAIDVIASDGSTDYKELVRSLVLLGSVYAGSTLFTWLAPMCSGRLACRCVQDIRSDAFNRLSRLPLQYYDTHRRGDIISRITNDADNISDGLSQSFVQLFSGIITVVGTLVAMLVISPTIAVIVICITPLSLIVARFVVMRSAHLFAEQQKKIGQLNAQAEEIISARRCVHSYNMEDGVRNSFAEANAELYKVGQKAQFISALINPSTRLVNNLSYICVGVVGAFFAASGITGGGRVVTIGVIATLLTYATQFAKPINEIAGVTTQIQNAIASAARISELINEQPEPPEDEKPLLETTKGDVKFSDVSFAYANSKPLIRKLNLDVQSGNIVAIVGRTGAGKTTLVNLLMRYYETESGVISIDGTDIKAVQRDSVRDSFAMVLQDTWLFSGTVRDNIAYGKPDATIDEIIEAAKNAHAHSFIKRLPQGYDTVISGDGSGLSQGQQQLLTIARVMLLNPPMLILDEATSSVDILTEKLIQQAFGKMMLGRTSFIIAHRLATIRHADIILVMENGDIAEQGSHEELMKLGGIYSRLINS